ncbi:uncharacterized protein LOC128553571 [Mercenaria mercenaria]|uniref:uncharacterized protein LOC128553571 n=1 Tax=Mercenaria mercenaria TaxID=6596 RepID=UPI00234EC2C5|nr:uncharacterized protein LOC128553571 [Mercenaria mercenaria]
MDPAPIVNHLSSVWDFRAKCLSSSISYSGFQGVHHFTFKMKEGRLKMLYKDWPSDSYSALDMTENVASLDFDYLVNAEINEKVVSVISSMEADLPKYSQAGRMEDEDQKWWETYLKGIERASRTAPIIPRIAELPKFSPVQETETESNTLSAMREHQRKLKQKNGDKDLNKKIMNVMYYIV